MTDKLWKNRDKMIAMLKIIYKKEQQHKDRRWSGHDSEILLSKGERGYMLKGGEFRPPPWAGEMRHR